MTSTTATRSTSRRTLAMPARLLLIVLLVVGTVIASLDAVTMFLFASYAALGAILVVRRPANAIGWIMIYLAFGFAGTTTVPALDAVALQAGTASWIDFLSVWLGGWAGYATFGGFALLTIVFPSGHLAPPRWLSLFTVGACALLTVLVAVAPFLPYDPPGPASSILIPNRFAILPDLALWRALPLDLLILPVIGLLAVGVVRMLLRYRRSTGVVRLQMRWLIASLGFMVFAIVFGIVTPTILDADLGGAEWLLAIPAFLLVPLSIFVAITRYRLYEIDRVISRTVSWILVTAVVAGVFAVGVIALQAVLAPVTSNNTLAVAGSTLLAAALFQPLRGRIQRAVDRRFNRRRIDAERVVGAFAVQVRDQVDLERLHHVVLATVDDAVAPDGAGLWLRAGP